MLARASANETVNGLLITIPTSGKYLLINDKKTGETSYRGNITQLLNSFTDRKYGCNEIGFLIDSYIDLSGTTADITTPTESLNYRYAVEECEENDVFTITGVGGGSAALLWGFLAEDGTVLSKAGEYETATQKRLTAPANAKYLVINDKKSGGTCLFGTNVYDSLQELESDIDDIQDDINEIRNSAVSKYSSEIVSVVDKVNGGKNLNTITLAFISDIHGSSSFSMSNTMALFNEVADRCGADAIINIGDLTYDSDEYCEEYWRLQNKANTPVLFSIGNHDVQQSDMCYGNSRTSKKFLNVIFSDDHSNWYVDINNLRIIGLDSQDGFSDATVSWLTSVLNNSTSKIAVFTHKPCRAGLNWNSVLITNASMVLGLINDYGSDVVGYFYGHTHCDNIFKSGNDKFPFINIACALDQRPGSSGIPTVGSPTAYDREYGTYSEFCFDVMNIDLSDNSVKLYRFGVGSDRTYTPA